MISDAKEIIDRLNSASDWAVVGGAATIGLVADGAINILPFPFFTPGMTALAAAGAALSLKRGLEGSVESLRVARRKRILRREIQRCMDALSGSAESSKEEFEWRLQIDGDDMAALEELARDARELCRTRRQYVQTQFEFRKAMGDVLGRGELGHQ